MVRCRRSKDWLFYYFNRRYISLHIMASTKRNGFHLKECRDPVKYLWWRKVQQTPSSLHKKRSFPLTEEILNGKLFLWSDKCLIGSQMRFWGTRTVFNDFFLVSFLSKKELFYLNFERIYYSNPSMTNVLIAGEINWLISIW